MQYRNEIDGLRAIAVLSVLIFHFFPEAIPGGYLGVDVFFTISGYIITATTIERLKEGDHSIIQFYFRRVNRLIPSFVTVIFSSIITFGFLFSSNDFHDFIESALSSITYLSNWYFLGQSGYFDEGNTVKPLLHTWSLSIEEQFYILFPLLFIPLLVRKKKVLLFSSITLITLISLIYANYLALTTAGDELYFSTFTRLWQIGVGSILALTLEKKKQIVISKWLESLLFIISASAYIYSIFVFNSDYKVPSYYSFIPLLLPLHVIYFYRYSGGIGKIFLSNILMQKIGKLSYQIYLWHWPIFVAMVYFSFHSSMHKLLGIIATIILSLLTFHVFQRISKKYLFVFSLSMTFLILIFIISFLKFSIFETKRNELLYGNLAEAVSAVNTQKTKYKLITAKFESSGTSSHLRQTICSHDDLHELSLFSECFRSNKSKEVILIIGDSTGRDTWLALQHSFPNKNFVLYHQSSCTPGSYGYYFKNIDGRLKYKNCFKKMDEVLDIADNEMNFKTIILAFRYFPERWQPFINNFNKMKSLNKDIVVLGVAPILNAHFHRHLARLGHSIVTGNASDTEVSVPNTFPNNGSGLGYWDTREIAFKAKKLTEEAGGIFIDLNDFFCSQGNQCRLWIVQDEYHAMYWDASHLTLEAIKEFGAFLKLKIENQLPGEDSFP